MISNIGQGKLYSWEKKKILYIDNGYYIVNEYTILKLILFYNPILVLSYEAWKLIKRRNFGTGITGEFQMTFCYWARNHDEIDLGIYHCYGHLQVDNVILSFLFYSILF